MLPACTPACPPPLALLSSPAPSVSFPAPPPLQAASHTQPQPEAAPEIKSQPPAFSRWHGDKQQGKDLSQPALEVCWGHGRAPGPASPSPQPHPPAVPLPEPEPSQITAPAQKLLQFLFSFSSSRGCRPPFPHALHIPCLFRNAITGAGEGLGKAQISGPDFAKGIAKF